MLFIFFSFFIFHFFLSFFFFFFFFFILCSVLCIIITFVIDSSLAVFLRIWRLALSITFALYYVWVHAFFILKFRKINALAYLLNNIFILWETSQQSEKTTKRPGLGFRVLGRWKLIHTCPNPPPPIFLSFFPFFPFFFPPIFFSLKKKKTQQ